jgi:predicted butyrate kinase (DUF1464 family)
VARTSELPELVGEFIELAKRYMRDQILDPAKGLRRLAGFSFAGAIVVALGVIVLSVAGARVIIELLPAGVLWSGLGYVLASIALLLLTALMMWRVTR